MPRLKIALLLVAGSIVAADVAAAQPPWVERAQRQKEFEKNLREQARETAKRRAEFEREARKRQQEAFKQQTEALREAEKREAERLRELSKREQERDRERSAAPFVGPPPPPGAYGAYGAYGRHDRDRSPYTPYDPAFGGAMPSPYGDGIWSRFGAPPGPSFPPGSYAPYPLGEPRFRPAPD
ncbi:hypothetical protein [Alienimonas sp. DA493]|uniref:hypothetical protein n=1 Tax=Alienimonas sp. DA493 TaxID=3373605 RepID=UPI00375438F8